MLDLQLKNKNIIFKLKKYRQMTIVFESVIDYLEKCGLIKTARVMRKELKVSKDIILDSDKELYLLSKNFIF